MMEGRSRCFAPVQKQKGDSKESLVPSRHIGLVEEGRVSDRRFICALGDESEGYLG